MPKILDWKFLYEKKFSSTSAYKAFQENQLCAMVDKNNKTKCTVCNSNSDSHKTENILLVCNSSACNAVDLCNVRYKVNHCLTSQKYAFYRLDYHEVELELVYVKTRGMTTKVKTLIRSLMFDFDITMSTKIEKKLHNKYKKNIDSDSNERMPVLKQIQNFVKNLRKKF